VTRNFLNECIPNEFFSIRKICFSTFFALFSFWEIFGPNAIPELTIKAISAVFHHFFYFGTFIT